MNLMWAPDYNQHMAAILNMLGFYVGYIYVSPELLFAEEFN